MPVLLRLSSADARILGRGLVILLVVIVTGVAAAERQINNLTRRHDYVQSFNIRRDGENYTACVLGGSLSVPAVYPLAALSNTGRSLTVSAAGTAVTVPTVVTLDAARGGYWLAMWRGQFVAAAYATKQQLAGYCLQLRLFLREMAGISGR